MPVNDVMANIRSMGFDNSLFDMQGQSLLITEIQQIQALCWDYLQADKSRDYLRRNTIFRILMALSKVKRDIPSLQEYFGGKRVGHFRNTITDENARFWVLLIMDRARGMSDTRVSPEPLDD